MDTDYISLGRLAQSMGLYDSMPVPIQKGLKNSIVLTIVTNIACIPILIYAPYDGYVSSDGFFIWFTADVINFLLGFAYNISSLLLALNVLSLIMTIVVLFTSWGMTRPVHESVHWLAWLAAFPSGVSVVSVITIITLTLAIVIVALILWILIIYIGLMIIGIIFGSG